MKRILIQLDTDELPSTFDAVVAADAGVELLLPVGKVTTENVESLVHGAMFTRDPAELKSTAIFVGGSDAVAAEKVFARVRQTFLGPLKVSVMLDPHGASTTAAAAVRCAGRHFDLRDNDALILGGTGPVGRRTAQLLASLGARVRVASRDLGRADAVVKEIRTRVADAKITPCEWSDEGLAAAVDSVELIVAAGTTGVQFLTAEEWQSIDTLKVVIDLNAVPPPGLGGIEATAKGVELGGVIAYGPIGVGGLKMKIHKAAVKKLFTSNDVVLDTEEIYKLAGELTAEN